MNSVELAAKINEAGGRAFVGFKEITDGRGVDEMGRVLVSEGTVGAAKRAIRAAGVLIEKEFEYIPAVVVRIAPTALEHLGNNPMIEYIEPIFPGRYLSQDTTWNVRRVGAPSAWTHSDGGGGILQIMDSGIDTDHADLDPSYVGACDGSSGEDVLGHGTAIAGIIAAVSNSDQIIGVSHGVSLWSTRIGETAPDPEYAACAVEFGRTYGADVMSISFEVEAYTALTDEINAAYYEDDIVVVGAAGNTNGGSVAYPATLGAVIAVSATDSTDAYASFSAIGSKVEISAPGTTVTSSVGLSSTCINGSVCNLIGGLRMEGTSFAAPHVAAAAAILARTNYSWSANEIRRRLGVGAVDKGSSGRDSYYGYGLLSVTGAIDAPHIVNISGPTMVPTNYSAEFTATPVGGYPPYTYTWRVDGVIQQQSSSSTFYWSTSDSYTVSVEAVDNISKTASAYQNVTVCPGWVFSC
jgi:hypothetical protein